MNNSSEKSKPKFKRMMQTRSGKRVTLRSSYDSYNDVKEACDRKLAEWERLGVLAPYRDHKSNDWLFYH